jgi:hypothetical protein
METFLFPRSVVDNNVAEEVSKSVLEGATRVTSKLSSVEEFTRIVDDTEVFCHINKVQLIGQYKSSTFEIGGFSTDCLFFYL